MKTLRISDIRQLPSVPIRTLLRAQARFLARNEFGGDTVFGPVIDGQVVPEAPLHAIRSGIARNVVLLTGTTRDEARLWSLYVPILRWVRPDALEGVLRHAVGDRWRNVIAAYRRSRPGECAGNLSLAISGDLFFRMPAIRLAEAQFVHRPADTRMYLFTWTTPVLRGRLGSPHAVEIPFVFGNLHANGVERYTGCGTERRALSDFMQDAWVAFARSGDPNHAGLPEWPTYRPDIRSTLVFDAIPSVRNDPLPEERAIWDDVPFDGFHPAIEHSLPTTREILVSFLKTRPMFSARNSCR